MRGASVLRKLLILIFAASVVVAAVASAIAGDTASLESPLFAYRHQQTVSSMTVDPGDGGGENFAWTWIIAVVVARPSVDVGSACAGSVCVGSLCGGSVCLGSACFGSVCYGSTCFGHCGSNYYGGVVDRGDLLEP